MSQTRTNDRRRPAVFRWTIPGRILVFALAVTSIWCLLAEMYGLCEMRTFTLFILLPATVALYGLAVFDRLRGDRRLWRAVIIGTLAGLPGPVVYDIFRLPFVFSKAWGLEAVVPQMLLFKVFPRFGALILGEPLEQPWYSLTAHLLGWAYHFSNGATFGVMFAASIGEASRRYGGVVGIAPMTGGCSEKLPGKLGERGVVEVPLRLGFQQGRQAKCESPNRR